MIIAVLFVNTEFFVQVQKFLQLAIKPPKVDTSANKVKIIFIFLKKSKYFPESTIFQGVPKKRYDFFIYEILLKILRKFTDLLKTVLYINM